MDRRSPDFESHPQAQRNERAVVDSKVVGIISIAAAAVVVGVVVMCRRFPESLENGFFFSNPMQLLSPHRLQFRPAPMAKRDFSRLSIMKRNADDCGGVPAEEPRRPAPLRQVEPPRDQRANERVVGDRPGFPWAELEHRVEMTAAAHTKVKKSASGKARQHVGSSALLVPNWQRIEKAVSGK